MKMNKISKNMLYIKNLFNVELRLFKRAKAKENEERRGKTIKLR